MDRNRLLKSMEKSLLELLNEYSRTNYYPFHMPGHKRNKEIDYIPAKIDITEIDGFDNLHHAEGVLLQAQKRAARLYGAEESFFLVNGSTAGILTAISTVCKSGEKILMARNSHKAAYHGVYLNKLHAGYIYPQIIENCGICGGILPEDVEKSIRENPDIKAVFITSPTYEGMVSNIAKIADIVHEQDKILIVDEAHGAHFQIGGSHFPKSAVSQGADIVIQSTHKTLPSMTQSAILHVCGERVDRRRLRKYLQIYQTSSPSYVMMAGMDSCYEMMEQQAEELFSKYAVLLDRFYEGAARLEKLRVISPKDMEGLCAVKEMDPSKICIVTEGTSVTGADLYHTLLEKYHIQPEMTAGNYVLAMTSIMDTEEGFSRLLMALKEIDEKITVHGNHQDLLKNGCPAQVRMSAQEADISKQEAVLFAESEGRISAEYRYIYPPGVPILVPGEVITREIIELLTKYETMGLSVLGQELSEKEIFVIVE